MPGMPGLSVARKMKDLRPGVPLVMLSGFASLPGETIGVVDTRMQKCSLPRCSERTAGRLMCC